MKKPIKPKKPKNDTMFVDINTLGELNKYMKNVIYHDMKIEVDDGMYLKGKLRLSKDEEIKREHEYNKQLMQYDEEMKKWYKFKLEEK